METVICVPVRDYTRTGPGGFLTSVVRTCHPICTILCYAMLCYVILYCTVMFNSVLPYRTPYFHLFCYDLTSFYTPCYATYDLILCCDTRNITMTCRITTCFTSIHFSPFLTSPFCMQVRALPIAVLRPTAGAAEALSYALLGKQFHLNRQIDRMGRTSR